MGSNRRAVEKAAVFSRRAPGRRPPLGLLRVRATKPRERHSGAALEVVTINGPDYRGPLDFLMGKDAAFRRSRGMFRSPDRTI